MFKLNSQSKIIVLILLASFNAISVNSQTFTSPTVDTDINEFFSNSSIISAPTIGDAYYGQDATYVSNKPSYTNNGDGTISDNITGLMTQQNMGEKINYIINNLNKSFYILINVI